MKGYRPVIWTAFAALALTLLMSACTLTPPARESQVRIIALGGSAVVQGDTLGIRSPAEVSAVSLDNAISIRPPTSGQTALLDDTIAIRPSAGGRMTLLGDVSRLRAASDDSTVTVAIRVVAEDRRGIDWIQIKIDGQPVGGSISPRPPVTHYTQDLCLILNPVGSGASSAGAYPIPPGSHTITVVASSNGEEAESEAITLDAAYGAIDQSLWKAVTQVEPCTAGLFPVYGQLPSPTPMPPTPAPSTPTPVRPVLCYDNAAYVADVTVPDGSQFNKGAAFDKTWRLRNTGTCTWDTRYQLVFVGGSPLSAMGAVAVPRSVPPNDTVDITVPMVAPNAVGTYRSNWQMRNPDCGNLFGSVVFALIQVRPGPGDPPVIIRFELVPNVISPGQSATIYWEYVNGTSARLIPGGEGGVGPTGTLVVSPNATTSYRLVVSNETGSVERAATLVVRPGPAPLPPPASPANLTVTAVRRDGFDFTWIDASCDEEGFRLYNADTRQVVATFARNTASGTISGLACGTPYRFYLVAFNAAGESWPGNTVQATTNPCDG